MGKRRRKKLDIVGIWIKIVQLKYLNKRSLPGAPFSPVGSHSLRVPDVLPNFGKGTDFRRSGYGSNRGGQRFASATPNVPDLGDILTRIELVETGVQHNRVGL